MSLPSLAVGSLTNSNPKTKKTEEEVQFVRLDNEGKPAGPVMLEEDHCLGVLLEIRHIDGLGYIGRFFSRKVQPKTVFLKIQPLDFVGVGSLVMFNINMYHDKLEKFEDIKISKVPLTYLDATSYYKDFKFNRIRKAFWCNIVNYKVSNILPIKSKKGAIMHPIFGRLAFNSDKVDLELKIYKSLPLSSNHLQTNADYANMKFEVKFIPKENDDLEAKESNGSSSNSVEDVPEEVNVFESFGPLENEETTLDNQYEDNEDAVETITETSQPTEVIHEENVVPEDENKENEGYSVLEQVDEESGKMEEQAVEQQSEKPQEEEVIKEITNLTSNLEVCEKNEDVAEIGTINDENIVKVSKDERKTEASGSDEKKDVKQMMIVVKDIRRENEDVVPYEIDTDDEDASYGILWSYPVRSSERTLAHVYCHVLEKKSAIVDMSTGDHIPIGGVVKFSMSEYLENLNPKDKWGKEKVSKVRLTYIPNHQFFNFQFRINGRHLISLENYTIAQYRRTLTCYEFDHPVLGTIADESKIIRDISYDRIQLCVIKRAQDGLYMQFKVFAVFETKNRSEADKKLRLLPAEERVRRMPELLKMEEDLVMEEERKKWKAVGTLEVKKLIQLNGIHGLVPAFKPEVLTKVAASILISKCVSVYLEEPGSEEASVDKLPYGLLTPYENFFCFTPNPRFRHMKFEKKDRYNFIPKSVDRCVEYFSKEKYVYNKLFKVAFPPVESYEAQPEKAKEMYTMPIYGEDPDLMGDEYGLNDEQKRAVRMSLNESRKIVLIHGPPGTGKTRTVAELIVQFVLRKKKIMVIAPTNSAIDNVYQLTNNLLTLRGIYNEQHQLPLLLTYEKLCQEMDACALSHDIVELREKLKNGEINQEDFDKNVDSMIKFLMRQLLKEALVCLCTTNNSFVHIARVNGFEVDTAIVDEAGMVLEPHLWTSLHSMNRIIMAGDPKQLPAFAKLDPSEVDKNEIENYQMSVMERLMIENPNNPNYVMLSVQYRMRPEIMRIASELFYDGQLRAHESVKNIDIMDIFSDKHREMPLGYKELREPVVFCDTTPHYDHSDVERRCFDKLVYIDLDGDGQQKPSYCNPGEAHFVVKYVELLINNEVKVEHISIITPYRAQVATILQKLANAQKTADKIIKVGTIDAFQGKENDIVIVSLVRSNPRRSIGFLLDDKRFNVLLTRAKRQLFLIGSSSSVIFNNRGKLPQFSKLLQSTNSIVCRGLLEKQYYQWANVQKDRFGRDFKAYMEFNSNDVQMKMWIAQFLANKPTKSVVEEDNEQYYDAE